ncbi:hypothetical protein L3X38_027126 [Prunus dulcis]|uniref:Uncharacterized protein n=1 Tax=Prunus dulcis TaxID=3755 RepID=A0AAD4Z023_PRUDU|nr:hypothetical protein L3X38_027126 [Prunus dulcis]
MIATRSGAKFRLFYATDLLARLTWSRWQMMFRSVPGMSDGDHANMSLLFWRRWLAPPSRLSLGTSQSALFCLAGQDPRGERGGEEEKGIFAIKYSREKIFSHSTHMMNINLKLIFKCQEVSGSKILRIKFSKMK